MSNKFQKLCQFAQQQSTHSNMKIKLGCVAIAKGKIQAFGYNTSIRTSMFGARVPSIHAERSCLSAYLRSHTGHCPQPKKEQEKE